MRPDPGEVSMMGGWALPLPRWAPNEKDAEGHVACPRRHCCVRSRGCRCGGCLCPLACSPALQGRLASVLSAAEVARAELTTVAAVAEAACAPGAPPLSRVHASRTVLASLPLALTRAPIPAPAPLGYQPPDVDPVLPIGCITGGDQVPGRAEAGAADDQVREHRVWHRARSPLRTVSHVLVRFVLVGEWVWVSGHRR
jgi:hypothetical protein